MEDFLGPFCKDIGLKTQHLLTENINPIQVGTLKSGVILELKGYQQRNKFTDKKVVEWIKRIDRSFQDTKLSTLKSRIERLSKSKKKLEHKKTVRGCATLEQLNNEYFLPTFPTSLRTSADNLLSVTSECLTDVEITCQQTPQQTKASSNSESCVVNGVLSQSPPKQAPSGSDTHSSNLCSSVHIQTEDIESDHTQKLTNLLSYEIDKKEKHLNVVKRSIKQCADKLSEFKSKAGHYSVKNVNKRDETARKTRHFLREAKYTVSRQNKLLKEAKASMNEKEIEISNLSLQNAELKKAIQNQGITEAAVKAAESLKIRAQKSASYFKVRSRSLKKQIESDSSDTINQLKESLKKKDDEISSLQLRIDELTEQIYEKISTKNSDGSYTDNIRLAVIELTGLEVAVEKVSPVIQSVSKIFGHDVELSDLPNSTTVQAIVDEGHYIAKTYIAQALGNAENWGINRDGTTRRKQKILDTSVTLDTGDVISLGFSRVAHETAVTINSITKQHMGELADTQVNHETSPAGSEDYIKRTLSNLAFTMSDRASNEKLADKLLTEWRDAVLNDCDEDQKKKVHHFHCMAHVLLGFHKYSCDDLKIMEKSIAETDGPLGRDALPVFKMWSKKGTVLERAIRTTSDIFGPAGDHHGLRDRWEAYCVNRGIKSTIGNYRDNRFNALFQTSAEIILHREDFLEVLSTCKQPNLKLISVGADLKSDIICSMMKIFGLLFLKVTGPYWNLITSGCVAYLELYSYIQDLRDFMNICIENPSSLLKEESHWLDEELLNEVPHFDRFLQKLSTDTQATEFESAVICLALKAMSRTIDKQLTDFLPEGQYSKEANKDDLKRTSFAHVTNLGCEHHFGDLDSSQKRRPNASMHHHSSIQLLKRNRSSMMQWLQDMPTNRRSELMKSARKGGRALRELHRNEEKEVLSEIHEEMMKMKETKLKKKKSASSKANQSQEAQPESDDEFEQEATVLQSKLPEIDKFELNEYVAVAYQDSWYPGCVESITENETAVVKFMTPCRIPGHFKWPQRQDKQTVQKQFVLKRGFIPECINSGRQWLFEDYKEIDVLYMKYKEVFF